MGRLVLGFLCCSVLLLTACGSKTPVPSVVLGSPNGGEFWAAGATAMVTWQSQDYGGEVEIGYSSDGGQTWAVLVAQTASDGTETVAVPVLTSTTARVRVRLLDWSDSYPPPTDASDADFTIAPTIDLTSPLGGESWSIGATETVTWVPGLYAGNVDIDLSTDGGATWSALVSDTANDGVEDVTVPAAPTHQARVRVGAADGDPSVPLFPYAASVSNVRIEGPPSDIMAGLPGVWRGDLAWGDFDQDGDVDLALAGLADFGRVARIYRNDGGTFVDHEAGLPGVEDASLAWGDYDNDGDLDLALSGGADFGRISRIYRNDAGAFVDIGAGMAGVKDGDLAWGDYDNDGDLDVLLTGYGPGPFTRIYRNDAGAFIDSGPSLPNLFASTQAWGDYDNDGDLDLALAGSIGASRISKIYRNDGGTLVDIGAGLTVIGPGALAWGDYDNDGDLDLVLAGFTDSGPASIPTIHIYRNDAGTFVDIAAALVPAGYCSVAWGDYDNDGDLDLVQTGRDVGLNPISLVYRNDGGTFVDLGAGLPGLWAAGLGWGDFDNDGDLDLAIAGQDAGGGFLSRIYRNDGGFVPNAVPSAPTGLAAAPAAGEVTLVWAVASDDNTPEAGLGYNLRIGSTATASEAFPSMAAVDGYRRIPVIGPIVRQPGGTVSHTVALPPGTYYASVQAVDASLAGGAWSDPVMFTVP